MVLTEPRRERPAMPAAYGVSGSAEGMLSWDEVERAIAGADIYWVATAGPDGDPHLTPIHAGFAAGRIHLSGDPAGRWVRNLAANPSVQVGILQDQLQAVVRGRAVAMTPDPDRFADLSANVASKYEWAMEKITEMWEVVPQTVLAFDVPTFATSPTRFRF